DVFICTGSGTGGNAGTAGGFVQTGPNLEVGNPYPRDNQIALNLISMGTTAMNLANNNNQSVFKVGSDGNTVIGTDNNLSNTVSYRVTKKLIVNGDVCFANTNNTSPNDVHANDGFSGLEILSTGNGSNGAIKVPSRRGITTDYDPDGDFNF